MTLNIRRVITGHDAQGNSIVDIDEVTTNIVSRRPGHASSVIWTTTQAPCDNMEAGDQGLRDVNACAAQGAIFRVVEYGPGVSPRMHRTLTIDYAVVMAGEEVKDLVYQMEYVAAGKHKIARIHLEKVAVTRPKLGISPGQMSAEHFDKVRTLAEIEKLWQEKHLLEYWKQTQRNNDATFNAADSGVHLDAAGFNALTDKPDTILIDMRNHYESEVGYFEGAIRPDVETFREEIKIAEGILNGKEDKNIVMYCTGGIRCEKASAYFKHKGFKNVFQLDGGIIQYTKDAKAHNLPNKFKGVNFVFDERLGERISDDVVAQCHQCGAPCDTHKNCANDACHLLFIQCEICAAEFNNTCSRQCADFVQLPLDEQKRLRKEIVFPGTKFGKGRRAGGL